MSEDLDNMALMMDRELGEEEGAAACAGIPEDLDIAETACVEGAEGGEESYEGITSKGKKCCIFLSS